MVADAASPACTNAAVVNRPDMMNWPTHDPGAERHQRVSQPDHLPAGSPSTTRAEPGVDLGSVEPQRRPRASARSMASVARAPGHRGPPRRSWRCRRRCPAGSASSRRSGCRRSRVPPRLASVAARTRPRCRRPAAAAARAAGRPPRVSTRGEQNRPRHARAPLAITMCVEVPANQVGRRRAASASARRSARSCWPPGCDRWPAARARLTCWMA